MKIVRKNLSQTKQPILIFKSKEDHVIPRVSAIYTFKKIGSSQKELIWLENSYHVATMDFDKDLIAEKSIKFMLGKK
jgi:carboxylesterase